MRKMVSFWLGKNNVFFCLVTSVGQRKNSVCLFFFLTLFCFVIVYFCLFVC